MSMTMSGPFFVCASNNYTNPNKFLSEKKDIEQFLNRLSVVSFQRLMLQHMCRVSYRIGNFYGPMTRQKTKLQYIKN